MILATPRTGSNLLLHSLENHPEAISAGEIRNDSAQRPLVHRWGWGEAVAKCNLCKFMWLGRNGSDWFRDLHRADGLRVHLWREDRDAQVDSWLRACRTGQWTADGPRQRRVRPPSKPNRVIDAADAVFRSIADLTITYESLVDQWDAMTGGILASAGWSDFRLRMAEERMPIHQPHVSHRSCAG